MTSSSTRRRVGCIAAAVILGPVLYVILGRALAPVAWGWYPLARYCCLQTGTEVWRSQGYQVVVFTDCSSRGCVEDYRQFCKRILRQGERGPH